MINLKREQIEIQIYHNTRIDEDSMREEFENDLKYILSHQKKIIKEFTGE